MVEAYANYRETFYKFMNIYGIVAGANMTDPNFRPGAITYMWICLTLSYNFSILYTIIAYRAMDVSWQSATIQGLCVQGCVKYLTLIIHAKRINAKVQFLQVLFKSNGDVLTKNYQALHKWSQRSLWFVKYGAIPFAVSSISFVMYPALMYYLNGDLYTLMAPMLLPGVDENSVFGYCLLSMHHISSMVLLVFGLCNVDFLMVLLVMHLWPISDLFANMVAELNDALENPDLRKSNELRVFFRNLIIMHTELCEYLEDISDIFYYLVMMEVFSDAESMMALVYCMLSMEWLPSYFLMVLMFSKLFSYCAIGTMAELATDRIYRTLIDCKWNLLPIREQHFIHLMIASAQNPTILMAGTMPLNLDTFVRVMKTVYSVAMLLAQSNVA